MGGLHPAYEYICAAIEAGKHVVTANKAVVAAYYPQLTALARQHGVALRCTAAVGGGIPWLVNLERCKRLDRVVSVGGIMNGTSNFIMDAMHASPVSFPDILKKAQDLGYAEADPSADIDGDDIRRKLAISANVAFDALIDEEAIPTFGIRTVTDGDIAAFQRRGFVCKLLAAAQLSKEGICAWIEPTLVESHALEAAVPQNFNLITYYGESIGRQSFFGRARAAIPRPITFSAGLHRHSLRPAQLLRRRHGPRAPRPRRRGAPLLRPHRGTRRLARFHHRRPLGERRRHLRRLRRQDDRLGQASPESRPDLLHRGHPVKITHKKCSRRIF